MMNTTEMQHWRSRHLGPVLILKFALVLVVVALGCQTLSPEERKGSPIVRVLHLSGGDAPIGTMLTLYRDTALLETLGGRSEVLQVSRERVAEIEALMQSSKLEGIATAPGRSAHEEEIWLEFDGRRVGFERDQPPKAARPLLGALQLLVEDAGLTVTLTPRPDGEEP